MEEKYDKLNFIQIKNFCSWEVLLEKKRKATDQNKIVYLQNRYMINDLYPEYI